MKPTTACPCAPAPTLLIAAAPALLLAAALALPTTACDERATAAPPSAPLARQAAPPGVQVAATLHERPPAEAFDAYLDGFRFCSGLMSVRTQAPRYCALVDGDAVQCVVQDAKVHGAGLVGVEYALSTGLLDGAPEPGKAASQAHVQALQPGPLIAPGLPPHAGQALEARLADTYGKTWQSDRDEALPMDVSPLMSDFIAGGPADAPQSADADRVQGGAPEDGGPHRH